MGSGEILVILLIALVVLGPEKLPKLAADIGRWVGRARSMARQLRSQLDQEVHLEEIRRQAASTMDAVNDVKPAPPPAAASPPPPPPPVPEAPPVPVALPPDPAPPSADAPKTSGTAHASDSPAFAPSTPEPPPRPVTDGQH